MSEKVVVEQIIEGEDESLWLGTTEKTNYPTLESDETVYDVAIVGGGITGIVTAYQMQKSGYSVVLLEKSRVVEWTTGGTTAKLTSQHYLVYDYLIKRHGQAAASAFAKANQTGIEQIEQLSNDLGIDCDFSRRSSYVFTGQASKVAEMKAEVNAALSLGLPASFEATVDLPYAIKGAVKFSNQAQFHPRKFLLSLVKHYIDAGGLLYEHTNATSIVPGNPHTIVTKQGDIRAKAVVQASGEPFWGGDILNGRMWVKMSYALAVKLKADEAYPKDMYITTESPMRTIRSTPYLGGDLMIFGGESHEYNEAEYDPDIHYKALIKDVYERFDVDKVLYRWLAGDNMPYDRMPYIGPLSNYPSIYIATGYRAWGLAWAMSAADALTSYVGSQPLDWVKHFSLERACEPLNPEDKNTNV